MEQQYFATQVRLLRKEKELSQEQMATALGVSVQAVSKWECAQSYPDLVTLVALADYFGVSVDTLLRPVCEERTDIHPVNNDMPNDGTLYIVQVRNGEILREDNYDPDQPISLCTEDSVMNLSVWGSAQIDGNISGNASAGGNLTCDVIEGDASAGGKLTCDTIAGNASAGGKLTCDTIAGDAGAGGSIECGDIAGDARACGNISCSDIAGDASASGNLSCEDIGGDASASSNLSCGDIGGDASAGDYIECGDIHGDVNAGGNISCGDIGGDVTISGGTLNCGDVNIEIS